jgi:hypothetical protein
MRIQLDQTFDSAKDLPQLIKLLNEFVDQLQTKLKGQPDFLLITSDDQEIPKSLPANTVVFKFDETDIVKTGFYDGENLQLP